MYATNLARLLALASTYLGPARQGPQRNLGTVVLSSFVRRLTRQRKDEVYDVDVKSLYGFQAGLWSTPTHALPRGIARVAAIVIGVAVARQRSTRSCQDARRELSG